MNLLVNSQFLDIAILILLVGYVIIGYFKGFVVRLYDFFSLFFAYFLALNFSYPISKLFILYKLEGMLAPIGAKLNQILIFIIIFILIRLILKGIGVLIKPFLKGIVSFLKITKGLDGILGMLLSFVEGLLFVYLVLMMVFMPFVGKEVIDDSVVASLVVNTMPQEIENILETNDINKLTELDITLDKDKQVPIMTSFLDQVSENDWLDKETVRSFIVDYYSDVDVDKLSIEDKIKLSTICYKYGLNINDLKKG